MRKLFNYAFIAVALLATNSMVAQTYGYIDSQSIIASMPEVQEANSQIETHKKQLQNLGQDMLKKLQTKYQALEQKQAQGAIAPKELEAEAQKLKLEEAELMKFEQESQQKVVAKSEELLKPIRDRIQKAIDEVAAENGYTYIFDFSTGFLLYADESANLEAKVKAKLGL